MKRIRIGKDISVEWTILTNGEAIDLDLSRLSLVLISPDGIRTTMSGVECSANKLTFNVGHDLQTAEGVYRLELWQDLESTNQTVLDKLKAFQLVSYTQMEGGDDDDNLYTDTDVDLGTGNLVVGISNTGITDAPDSNLYGRRKGTWEQIDPLTDSAKDGNIYGRKDGAWTAVEAQKPSNASYITYVDTTYDATTNTFYCSISGITELKNGMCLAINLCHDMTADAVLQVNSIEDTAMVFRALPNNGSFYSRYVAGSIIIVTCYLGSSEDVNNKGWWICDYSANTDSAQNDEAVYPTFKGKKPTMTLVAYNDDGSLVSLYNASSTKANDKVATTNTISTDSHIYYLYTSSEYADGSTPTAYLTMQRTLKMSGQIPSCWNVPMDDKSTWTPTAYTAGNFVYMRGKITDREFTLDSLTFVESLPTTADGYHYWRIGQYISASAFMLCEDQPIYYIDSNGKLQRY